MFGTLARKAVAWVVLIAVALVALKIVFGIVAGLVMALLWSALLVGLAVAVIWAVRRILIPPAPASVAYLVLCFFFGLAGGIVGKIKGSSFVALVPDLRRSAVGGLLAALLYRNERDELRRQCPGCGKDRQAPRRDLHPLRHRARLPRGRDRARIGRDAPIDWRPAARLAGTTVPGKEGAPMMRAVDAIMECLKAEGVDVVFGYPGGANLPTYDAFVDAGIRHILVRHEAGGGHAAEGYAKASGKVGVVFATSGPGATNIVTPLTDAMMDSVPLVAFTGQVRTDLLGTDGFQEADTFGITMPIVKHSFMIQHPAEIPRVVHEAFHIARTGRPGPVLIDMPVDLTRAEIDYEPVGDVRLPGYQPTTEGNSKQIRLAAKALANARRPVIYAGGGVINADASAELTELALSRPPPGHLHADGPRRVPGAARRSGSACSACTAPARPTTRWTRPT